MIFVGPALAIPFNKSAITNFALAIFMSTFALAWSYVFNTLFERLEVKQTLKGRSWLRRAAHSLGFEGGLVIMLVPVMAWWLNISLIAAFMADLGVLAFFFVSSFVFTWGFDRLFGLPTSAAHECDT